MDTNDITKDAKAVITIVLRQDGAVGVMGPIGDKILALGMLALAKQAILAQRPATLITKPIFTPPNDIHRPKG